MADSKKKVKKRQLITIGVLVLILIIVDLSSVFLYLSLSSPSPAPSQNLETATVTQILDGNTLELDTGQIISLIGIQAPSSPSQPYYGASAYFLNFLTLNKQVRLEKDSQVPDISGRLLRYVYVDYNNQRIFLNAESVRQGYSIPQLNSSLKYNTGLEQARADCLKTKLNLCS